MCLLRDEGLLEQHNGEWMLAAESGIPPVESLWQDALRHDSRSLSSLLALGRAGLHLENVLSGQIDGGALREEIYTASVARAFNHADLANLGMERALNAVVQHLAETWSGPTRLRILEIGAAPGNLTKLLDAKLFKGAIISLNQAAELLGEFGITVNTLAPGMVETENIHNRLSDEEIERKLQRFPLHRAATAEEVAEAAVHTLRSGAMTGETVNINSGVYFAP